MNSQFNAAFGSIVGAFIGDAAGSTLEFLGRTPSKAEVEEALQIVGGGVFGLAPGQITDDGELTICLLRAIADSGKFDIQAIARNYGRWLASVPFDVGMTTRTAIGAGVHLIDEEQADIREIMRSAARMRSMGSKANGSLMRATPIGVFAHSLGVDQIASLARMDSEITHPNDACCDSVACYSIAIASLVRNPGDVQLAWQLTTEWASVHAADEVNEWLQLAKSNVAVTYYPQAGFVKIAFVHAFRHLLAGTEYVEAIRETLAGGGDTDTNACIVGGLIGASCGADAIPKSMQLAVLNCDTTEGSQPRDSFLSPADLHSMVTRLLMAKQ